MAPRLGQSAGAGAPLLGNGNDAAEWGTKSGKNSTQGSKATGERYLPKKARESLSKKEYAATSRKKRADTAKGKQFSSQPKKIAKKTSRHR